MNRRVWTVVVALVLGAIGTFVMVAYVRDAADRAAAGERMVKVLLIDESIEVGTPAEELRDKVVLERIPAKARAEGSVTSVKQLGDRVAATNLVEGEQLVKGRFVDASVVRAGSGLTLPDGFVEVSLSLDPERAAGGLVQRGGTVSVVASVDGDVASATILREILVTDVRFEDQLGTVGGDDEATEADPAPSGKFLLTVGVDSSSAELLVQAAEKGTVWLVADPKDGR